MNPIDRQWRLALRIGRLAGGEQIHKQHAPGLCCLREHLGVELNHCRAFGINFIRDRRKQHKFCSRMQACELIQITFQGCAESGEARRAGKGFVHAVTQHHNLRGPRLKQILHVRRIAFRPQSVRNLIAGPCQAAEVQIFPRLGQLHPGLQFPMFQQPFHHGISVEKDGVVWLK